ncbi:MAG: DUF4062 domain-containing protein [Frankiaceae bacterium]
MDDRPLRAFLSHTAELREHPAADPFVQAAERAVTRAGHAVVDMAYFTARDDKPAKYCRQKVSECDVYVGLIGFRYGSPVRDERDKSYVELEYETAGQAGLTRLLFLFSEHPTVPLPIEAVTDSNFGDRQTRFRQDIRDTTKANFDSPAQLETLLYQALVERAGADARGPVRPAPFMAPRQDDSLIDRPEITRPALTALTADALLRSTGRWPMLLKLVSGAIRDEVRLGRPAADAAAEIAEQLRVEGPTVLDVADQGQRHAAVSSTLEVSIRRLGDDVDRYLKI